MEKELSFKELSSNYKELVSIADEIVNLQARVQKVCSLTLHSNLFLTAASFKVALMSAMCEINESLSKCSL